VVSFSTTEGLSAAGINSIVALSDGSVWVANAGAINVIRGNHVSSITAREGLPGQQIEAMLQDQVGRVWLAIDNKIAVYQNGRFLEVKNSAGSSWGPGAVASFAEDPNGNIWALKVNDPNRHLLRIRDQQIQEDVPLDDSIRRAQHMASDR